MARTIWQCIRIAIKNRKLIAILQPGRVGSVSLFLVIPEAHHFHHIAGRGYKTLPSISSKVKASAFKELVKFGAPSLILSPTRNPVDWIFSGATYFFHNDERLRTYLVKKDSDALRNRLSEMVLSLAVSYSDWYDANIVRGLGIDMFKHSFDSNVGYQIIRNKNIILCLFQMEKMDIVVPTVVSQLIGRKLQTLQSNSSKNLYSTDEMQFIRNNFPYDLPEIRAISEGKIARHFGYYKT